MLRARQHLIDRDIVTVPDDERIDVIPTPEYLRNVIPFAAYFDPPKFDDNPSGIYIVTPSVNDDPNAMREHNYSAISNTSIHEAYPGHHLQLSVAGKHPSLSRALTNAPEFVEGWGMYSEQMMREQGFDDAPNFRLNMYTDAIWRACRIILDVRMHRGEIGVDEAIRFMVEQTSFEEPNARAEVLRYTYTPTYQLSYLLGKVLLLQLRADEAAPARLGVLAPPVPRHAAAQRQPADQLPAPAAGRRGGTSGVVVPEPTARPPASPSLVQVIPAIDLEGGRSRIVYWPGASAGVGVPTDRPDLIAEQFVEQGARIVHLVDFDGARAGEPVNLEAIGSVAARVAVPLQVAGGLESADQIRLAFAAGATRVVLAMSVVDQPDLLRACLEVAGDWLAVGLDPRPDRFAAFPWQRPDVPTLETLVTELVGLGVRRFVLAHGRRGPDLDLLARLVRSYDADVLVAGGATDLGHDLASSAMPASTASSSESRSSPGPLTTPLPWRPPHDPFVPSPGDSPRSARLSPSS